MYLFLLDAIKFMTVSIFMSLCRYIVSILLLGLPSTIYSRWEMRSPNIGWMSADFAAQQGTLLGEAQQRTLLGKAQQGTLLGKAQHGTHLGEASQGTLLGKAK